MSNGDTQSALAMLQTVCPIMSTAAPVQADVIDPASVGGGKILAMAQQQQVLTMFVPCVRDKCQLWDAKRKGCGLVTAQSNQTELVATIEGHLDNLSAATSRVANGVQHLHHLEPPANGKAPLSRLADAIEKWVSLLQEKKK